MEAIAPPPPIRSRTDLITAYREEIRNIPGGERIDRCIQCGTCTGSCPVSAAMDIPPRRMIALFRSGRLDDILRSRSIWICASCYACTTRCPNDIRVTDHIYALKRLGHERGIFPRDFPAYRLARAFADNVRAYGRNWELWLGIRYFLLTDPKQLLSRASQRFALAMIRRKRLPLQPPRIGRIGELRRIIDKAEALGGVR